MGWQHHAVKRKSHEDPSLLSIPTTYRRSQPEHQHLNISEYRLLGVSFYFLLVRWLTAMLQLLLGS